MKRRVLCYLDPGFMLAGHYLNMAETISAESAKRGVKLFHFVGRNVSVSLAEKHGLSPIFSRPSYEMMFACPISSGPTQTISTNWTERILATCPAQKIVTRLRSNPNSIISRIAKVVNRSCFNNAGSQSHQILSATSNTVENPSILSHMQIELAARFRDDMAFICDGLKHEIKRGDELVFYMYSGHFGHCLAVSEFLATSQHGNSNIRFFMNLLYHDFIVGRKDEDYAQDLKEASEILDLNDPSRRIVICMDSRQSVERYQPCFKRKLRLMPIPLYHSGSEVNTLGNNHQLITIGYFGQPIAEQGYALAVGLYEEFIERRNKHGLCFLMRINEKFASGDFADHFQKFKKKTDRINIVDHFVDSKKHHELISRCDIVIIPYMKECYPSRTSGILVDSLVHGKVVVVPQDTWMSDMVMKYGAGRTFTSGDLSSLVLAVDDVVADYSTYSASASRNIDKLYFMFSSESLLNNLFDEECSDH